MQQVDWKRKLSSRKFWVSIVTFITSILICFNVPEGSIAQITAVIMTGGSMIAYILSEGYIDAKAVDSYE